MSIIVKMEPIHEPLVLAKAEMTDSKESPVTCSQIKPTIGSQEEIPLQSLPNRIVEEGGKADLKEEHDHKTDHVDSGAVVFEIELSVPICGIVSNRCNAHVNL